MKIEIQNNYKIIDQKKIKIIDKNIIIINPINFYNNIEPPKREMQPSPSRRRFLYARVDNEILLVNPHLYSPLQLREGQTSPLGLFVFSDAQQLATDETGNHVLEYWPAHDRSAILVRALIADDEQNIYRDIDLKGIGWIVDGTILPPGEKHDLGGRYGLLDRDTAFVDYDMSEQFHRAGIRTHRTLALIGLEELIVNGQKVTLEEAIQMGVIDEDFHPVVQVRAFGTKARVHDIVQVPLLEQAIKVVAEELHRENLSAEEYAEWFAETLGRNLGIMHKNGWYHKYLRGGHNVTLDCRITDLDSVRALKSEEERLWDIEDACGCITRVSIATSFLANENLYHLVSDPSLISRFNESYIRFYRPRSETTIKSAIESFWRNMIAARRLLPL